MWSASCANSSIDSDPETAMPIGTPPSGASQIRAESTRKYSPS